MMISTFGNGVFLKSSCSHSCREYTDHTENSRNTYANMERWFCAFSVYSVHSLLGEASVRL